MFLVLCAFIAWRVPVFVQDRITTTANVLYIFVLSCAVEVDNYGYSYIWVIRTTQYFEEYFTRVYLCKP